MVFNTERHKFQFLSFQWSSLGLTPQLHKASVTAVGVTLGFRCVSFLPVPVQTIETVTASPFILCFLASSPLAHYSPFLGRSFLLKSTAQVTHPPLSHTLWDSAVEPKLLCGTSGCIPSLFTCTSPSCVSSRFSPSRCAWSRRNMLRSSVTHATPSVWNNPSSFLPCTTLLVCQASVRLLLPP